MKANEAPKRIWINSSQDLPCNSVDSNSIEYVRYDAFIEKACAYLEPKIWAMNMGDQKFTDECIEDFKNYMKGK